MYEKLVESVQKRRHTAVYVTLLYGKLIRLSINVTKNAIKTITDCSKFTRCHRIIAKIIIIYEYVPSLLLFYYNGEQSSNAKTPEGETNRHMFKSLNAFSMTTLAYRRVGANWRQVLTERG